MYRSWGPLQFNHVIPSKRATVQDTHCSAVACFFPSEKSKPNASNFFCKTYQYAAERASFSDGKNWQNSGFVAKFLTKFALFDELKSKLKSRQNRLEPMVARKGKRWSLASVQPMSRTNCRTTSCLHRPCGFSAVVWKLIFSTGLFCHFSAVRSRNWRGDIWWMQKNIFGRHFCQMTDRCCRLPAFRIPRRYMRPDSLETAVPYKFFTHLISKMWTEKSSKIEQLQIFSNGTQQDSSCLASEWTPFVHSKFKTWKRTESTMWHVALSLCSFEFRSLHAFLSAFWRRSTSMCTL